MLLQGRVAKLPSHFMRPNLFFAGGRGLLNLRGCLVVVVVGLGGSWVASVEALKLPSHPLP